MERSQIEIGVIATMSEGMDMIPLDGLAWIEHIAANSADDIVPE